MWAAEHRLTDDLDPTVVWQRWVDPNNWPIDDPGTAAAHFDGPPRLGVTGWVKPVHGPRVNLTISRCEVANHRFDVTSRLPGARMILEHRLHPHDAGWTMVHRIRFEGPAAGFWGVTLGRGLAQQLPVVMGQIAAAARRG